MLGAIYEVPYSWTVVKQTVAGKLYLGGGMDVQVMNLTTAYGLSWKASQCWISFAFQNTKSVSKWTVKTLFSGLLLYWFVLGSAEGFWNCSKHMTERLQQICLEMCFSSATALEWILDGNGLFGAPSWHISFWFTGTVLYRLKTVITETETKSWKQKSVKDYFGLPTFLYFCFCYIM